MFKKSPCDSRYNVNIMLEVIAEKMRVDRIQPLKVTLAFSNSSRTTPYGTISKLHVQVGDFLVHVDFLVVEMVEESIVSMILGRPLMAIVVQ